VTISKQASRGHLIVGALLVVLSLCCVIAATFFDVNVPPFLVFFFGIWGGVERGRYLEHFVQIEIGALQPCLGPLSPHRNLGFLWSCGE
jgi:hypothetical protein